VQAVPPTDGAEPELFLFDAHGPHGVRMLAAPSGLEYHGSIAHMARDWVTTHVVSVVEAQTRMHERIRLAAHEWQDRDRSNALLWRDEVLADLERWLRQASGAVLLGDIEALFVAASRRAGRRVRWFRRLLVAALVAIVLAAVAGYSVLHARIARREAQTSLIQGEVGPGRQVLHDDTAAAELRFSVGPTGNDLVSGATDGPLLPNLTDVDGSEKRTERIVARVQESMLKRVAALARASDRKIADWAYLVIKREVERAEARAAKKRRGRSRSPA
jgi:hypothetical protein